MTPLLTICIATRNRPADLEAALLSLKPLSTLDFDVLVTDDASTPPADRVITKCAALLGITVDVARNQASIGYIAARNEMASRARGTYILSLDDDARLKDVQSINRAVDVLDRDPSVAAVALAQETLIGCGQLHWMQPASVEYMCQVQTYFGYGHIVRRATFLEVGGYQELFRYYYEEPEFCKRLLNKGYTVVYNPAWRVIHSVSPVGRNEARIQRYVARNQCLEAILTYPIVAVLPAILAALLRYFVRRRRQCQISGEYDIGGLFWVLGELVRNTLPAIKRRKPIRHYSLFRWRAIRRSPPPYAPPSCNLH